MTNPFAQQRNAVVSVNAINNLAAELQALGDIELSWDFDSTHTA